MKHSQPGMAAATGRGCLMLVMGEWQWQRLKATKLRGCFTMNTVWWCVEYSSGQMQLDADAHL